MKKSFITLFCLFSTVVSFAGEQEDNYITESEIVISEHYAAQLELVRHEALRKHCWDEYIAIQDHIKGIRHLTQEYSENDLKDLQANLEDALLSPPDELGVSRNGGYEIPACEDRAKAQARIDFFNEKYAYKNSELLDSLESVIRNESAEPSFDERKRLADTIRETLLEKTMDYQTILKGLEHNDADENMVHLNALLDIPGVVDLTQAPSGSVASSSATSSAEAAATVQERCSYKHCKHYTFTTCRCEKSFCSKHYRAEKHDCGFDQKEAHRKELAKRLIKVEAEKLDGRI